MSCHCCSSSNTPPHKAACPGCQQQGDTVSATTLLHQLARPWQQTIGDQQYYFCRHPECEVVYFDSDSASFNTDALRQPVGQKSGVTGRPLCYCFDIRYSDIADNGALKQCRDFVTEKTRSKQCSCETHNPSGRCCLRDFPKEKE